jgi:hypothetical protein
LKKSILHIVLFCLLSIGVNAQRASAIVDRQKILLGEQFQLELRLEGVPTNQVAVVRWFNVADTFNHLEVVNRLKIDTIDVNGNHTYIQKFVITSFDSGRWVIPALSVYVASVGSANPNVLKTQPIAVDVLPVDVSAMQDYHPIKDILEVEPSSDWWKWVAIAIGVVIITLIILRLTENRKKKKPKKEKHTLSALQEALSALSALQEKNGNASLSNKEFYLELESIYRRYFTRVLKFDAMQTTPDELMMRLKIDIQSNEYQTPFFQLIRLVAAVKYAKFQPADSERISALDITTSTIKYVDQLQGGNK